MGRSCVQRSAVQSGHALRPVALARGGADREHLGQLPHDVLVEGVARGVHVRLNVREPAAARDRDHVLAGRYELEVAGERVPAEVFLDPPYDPKGARVRG